MEEKRSKTEEKEKEQHSVCFCFEQRAVRDFSETVFFFASLEEPFYYRNRIAKIELQSFLRQH